jgi:hypothetical protein
VLEWAKMTEADGAPCPSADRCSLLARPLPQAIAVEATKPVSERLAAEVDGMSVDPSYAGPHLPPLPPPGAPVPTAAELAADPALVGAHGVSLGFVRALMAEYKAQRGLPKKYSLQLLLRLNTLLRSLPSLVRVPFPSGADRFNVCGDTHGQYYDTLNVFGGSPSGRVVVFQSVACSL